MECAKVSSLVNFIHCEMSVVVPKWQRHVGSLGRLHYPASLLTHPKQSPSYPAPPVSLSHRERKNRRSIDKQCRRYILPMNIIYSSTKPQKKDLLLINKHTSLLHCAYHYPHSGYTSAVWGCFTQCSGNNYPMFSTTYPGRAIGSAQQLFMVCSY